MDRISCGISWMLNRLKRISFTFLLALNIFCLGWLVLKLSEMDSDVAYHMPTCFTYTVCIIFNFLINIFTAGELKLIWESSPK